MINLREEMDKIIDDTGHYILLQRTNRKIRCTCWNEKYNEADSTCPKCLGKGWVSRIERHKIRRDNASQVVSLPDLLKQHMVGTIASGAKVYFFKYDVAPKAGDVIMEVGWNRNQPTHLISAYEISSSDDLREQNGRVEFYRVVTKEKTIETGVRRIAVRRIGPMRNYEIIHKG